MGKNDIQYFNALLQEGATYRISNFTSFPTIRYQRTLDNTTTLRFGKYTKFENIPSETFPMHYFNFVSYNQLYSKTFHKDTPADKQPTLTDYIGCLTRVDNVRHFGSVGSNQTVLRKLDIENLNGDVVELTLWDEMAEEFNKDAFEKMPKPVIIVVSSCKVTEYAGGMQLSASSATRYYLNPDIPELKQLQTDFVAKYEKEPTLDICKSRYADPYKEMFRNRFALSTLLNQKPESYRSVRFTSEATITGINTDRDWYYPSCTKCIMKVVDGTSTPACPDHGPQPEPAYRYNFKIFISDSSDTATLTCFTPNAYALTGYDCNHLVKKYNTPTPRDFPTEILENRGKTHIFQFHYNPMCEAGKVDFYFDAIHDQPLQIARTISEQELTDIGESSGTPSAKETLAITPMSSTQSQLPPEISTAATPEATTPTPSMELASTPDFLIATTIPTAPHQPVTDTNPESLDKEESTTPRATHKTETKALKRALFGDQPPEHKKGKKD